MVQGEGQLLSRAKQEGDSVAASEMLCEVATDKVNMEVESPFSGTLTKLLAESNQDIPFGQPIAMVMTDAADLLGGLLDGPDDQPPGEARDESVAGATSGTPADGHGGPRAAIPPSRRSRQPAISRRAAARRSPGGRPLLDNRKRSRRHDHPWRTSRERPPRCRRARGLRLQRAEAPVAHPARSAASPVSVPPAPVPVSGTASSGDHSALDGSTRVGPTPSRSGRAIRAVVGRRMAKPATVPQFAVLTDIDLEALDRVRQGLGVHSLQALVTPPEMCVPSHGAVARQPAGRNGGLTVRLQYGVRLTVDHRVADGADAARALTRLTAPLTRREIWLQAPAHPDETGRGTPSKSLCHGSGVGCSAHSVYSLLW